MHQKQATKASLKMTSFSIVFEILFLVIIANAQQQSPVSSSELCYLADGSSSLTLTVNEATPVGSVIGIIDVNGDPALGDGNVDLLDGAPAEGRAAPTADLAASSASRQNRRLFGRRDTSLAHSASGAAQTEPSTTASSSFYSLLAAGSTAGVTPNSGSSSMTTTATSHNQQPSAVRVQPGTKNLILARPLDKESAEGDLSQLVNVRCRPRRTTTTTTISTEPNDNRGRGFQQLAPSSTSFTTIPIRLIITDANDHAPEFVGQLPYVINISETTPLNSIVSRDILALDKDSAGPHSTIHYRVLDSDSHGQAPTLASHFAFVNPLEPALSLTSPLDYESLPAAGSFTLSIVAQDQGEPEPLQSIAQVQVNVLDSDDQNPRFLDEKYTLVMDETQASSVGHNLRVSPRNLKAEDGDRGINAPILYSFDSAASSDSQSIAALARARSDEQRPDDETAGTNIERYLHLNPASGEIRLIRQWPAAGIGLPLTLVVRACQADNRDRYALTTLTIMRATTSSDDTQSQQTQQVPSGPKQGIEFLEQRVVVQVAEDTPINERIARVKAHHIQDRQQQVATGQQQAEIIGSNRSGAANRQSGWRGPINYQILDDPNDQFEVNGSGEIFLRHSLDYEQRQEFRFRVLATYTKYSDICHVQIAVLNVNDHKPKFTQAQYSLHLTESRLRSNSIGHVQAHDADLNDTVQYSIVSAISGDQQRQANLFEIGPTGQIGLKPGLRQLNSSLFQLVVQARDTLGPAEGHHTQQARVNIHVAQEIISRSLVHGGDQQDQEASSEPRESVGLAHSRYTLSPQLSPSSLSSSSSNEWTTSTPARKTSGRDSAQRLLKEHSNTNDSAHFAVRTALTGAESSTIASYQHQLDAHLHQGKQLLQQQQQQRQPNPSNQRSSLATVMASLQHMAKSVNFLEMPISSALLLTVLLTFLVCLLLIVVISMSVHVYRISSRARSRRSQHKRLAAAARLRHHAQMAAAAVATSASTSSSSPYNSAASSSSSCGSSQAALPPPAQQQQVQTIAQAVQDATRMAKENRAQAYYDNLAMAESSAIAGGNKLKQTRANMVDLEAAAGGQHQRSLSLSGSGGISDTTTNRRMSSVTSPSSSSTSSTANASRLSLASSPSLLLASAAAAENGANKHKKVAASNLKLAKSDQANKTKRMKELESKQFKALKISISNEATNIALGGTYLCDQPDAASSKQNPLYLESMGTSLSGASGKTEPKHRAPLGERPLGNKSPASTSVSSATTTTDDDDDDNSSAANCGHYSVNGTMELQSTRQQTNDVKRSKVTPSGGSDRNSHNREGLGKTISDLVMGHERDHSERRSDKTTEPTPVTIDSYRRLSLMDSLTRPSTSTKVQDRQQLFGQLTSNKVAPSERANLQLKRPVVEPQYRSSGGGGLMAMVRAEVEPASQRHQYQAGAQIKWPSESIPQRIKKLTWDDELSCCEGGATATTSPVETIASSRLRDRAHSEQEDECYVSPNVRIGSASGDMEREMHRYKDQSRESQTNRASAGTPQHTSRFLFSLGNHMLPSLNLQQSTQQQQQQHHRPHAESYQFDPQYLDHLLDDHPSDLTLASLASGPNQNNCLDYTIVDDSQFLASSLANTSNDPAGGSTGGQRQSAGESAWIDGRHDRFESAASSQMAPPRHQMDSIDEALSKGATDQQQSLTSNGQTHVIFKLNQNYQDLKLMTTAIL